METFFVTKYALTQGILEIKAIELDNEMIKQINEGRTSYYHDEGREWHRTKDEAIKKANEMREKKLASLKKQIVKLESLSFD